MSKPCLGCKHHRLFMCTHNGKRCGYCVQCCSDRKKIAANNPGAEKALILMTWNEFKELVDSQLAEKGESGDIEIHYIDISYPDDRMEIGISEEESADGKDKWKQLYID